MVWIWEGRMDMDKGILQGFWLEIQVVVTYAKIVKLIAEHIGGGVGILFCPC